MALVCRWAPRPLLTPGHEAVMKAVHCARNRAVQRSRANQIGLLDSLGTSGIEAQGSARVALTLVSLER